MRSVFLQEEFFFFTRGCNCSDCHWEDFGVLDRCLVVACEVVMTT